MAFFTYPPNEAISPLFTQISVSSITTGTNVFGSETVANSITSFSYSKPADVGTTDGRVLGVRARVTGNTNQTTGAIIALRSETRRSTLSASVSDTVSFTGLSLGKGALIDFTAASIPATYTSTGTHRAILIDQVFGSNLTGNTLAISNIFGIEFVADSQANTGRKANIKMNALSGGTSGNAQITDNDAYTGSWFINSTTTNKSSFTGAIATVRFDVASAATITALDSTRNFVKLTGSTATALQGITAGIDGQKLTLVNLTGANLTVANENAGATAANRITTMTGADVVLPTVASADNSPIDISDAEMIAKCIGSITIDAPYIALAANSVVTESNLGLLLKQKSTAADGNLYAVCIIRGIATYAASSLVFRYGFLQD
ncbi:hypothetical protein EB077_12275 [bacterium]|nr:hypothetical protein [bacterium]